MLFRYVRAVAGGSIITLALLWLMQSLIRTEARELPDPGPGPDIAWAEVREEAPVDAEPPPQRPAPPAPPPEAPVDPWVDPAGGGPAIPPQAPGGIEPPPRDDLFAWGGDGPLVAIVKVQPDYPGRAEQLGLEGWVLVEFDVDEAGGVENVRVLDSSHGVFEKAAIRATQKFRYRPKVVDGVARPTRGLRHRFRFVMERG